jgi:hypothetical protein
MSWGSFGTGKPFFFSDNVAITSQETKQASTPRWKSRDKRHTPSNAGCDVEVLMLPFVLSVALWHFWTVAEHGEGK